MARPKKKVVKDDSFEITLNLGGKIYKGAGATLLDALIDLPEPAKITSKGILTVSNGELANEQLFFPVRLKRLFYNKMYRVIQAKNLGIGLKPVR